MLELSHRRIGFCAALLLAASCSSKKIPSEPEPPPSAEVMASIRAAAVSDARIELDKGEELAHGGQWNEARLAFDRAVDLLLEMPGGIAASPESEGLYDEIIATIHETERARIFFILVYDEEGCHGINVPLHCESVDKIAFRVTQSCRTISR